MTEVIVFVLRNYLVVEKHHIELDREDFIILPETLQSLIKHSGIRGKAFIIFVKDRVYYAAKDGKDFRIVHLTAKE